MGSIRLGDFACCIALSVGCFASIGQGDRESDDSVDDRQLLQLKKMVEIHLPLVDYTAIQAARSAAEESPYLANHFRLSNRQIDELKFLFDGELDRWDSKLGEAHTAAARVASEHERNGRITVAAAARAAATQEYNDTLSQCLDKLGDILDADQIKAIRGIALQSHARTRAASGFGTFDQIAIQAHIAGLSEEDLERVLIEVAKSRERLRSQLLDERQELIDSLLERLTPRDRRAYETTFGSSTYDLFAERPR